GKKAEKPSAKSRAPGTGEESRVTLTQKCRVPSVLGGPTSAPAAAAAAPVAAVQAQPGAEPVAAVASLAPAVAASAAAAAAVAAGGRNLSAAMVAAQSPRRTREGRWPGSYPCPRPQRSSGASWQAP